MSLESVRRRMASAAARVGRSVDEVTLVVVTKGRSTEQIIALYAMGHRDFGENRAQELALKAQQLPADISWHFVGPLQTNKVRIVRPVTTLLHSLDRPALGRAWVKGPGVVPPALLQVNIGRESQKHGVDPRETTRVFAELIDLGVPLVGLMAIPPLGRHSEDSRPYFRSLAQLSAQIRQIRTDAGGISMGMTDDFEVAVEEGATSIRVGRAIFEPT